MKKYVEVTECAWCEGTGDIPCNSGGYGPEAATCHECLGEGYVKVGRPRQLIVLTKREASLALQGMSFYASDYKNAPHDDIAKLKKKLAKMGVNE